MIFSSSTEYAIRGLSELACRDPDGPLMLDQLVAGTDLPRDFLAKVFQKLVHGGVLRSAKGRGGGFSLARKPGAVKLTELIRIFQGTVELNECLFKKKECPNKKICCLKKKICRIERYVVNELKAITLASLI